MNRPTSMSEFKQGSLPDGHPEVNFGRTGVLLVNLGTPDATDYWSMRRYLKEFLSDRRVIETPRIIWWPILNGIVLTTRPKKSGAAYDEIWDKERDESPLRTTTRSQYERLKERLSVDHPHLIFDWAMRYGNPSIHSRLDALKEQGCERIVVVPLYPQYSAATTATVNDKVFEYLMKQRWQPAVRTAAPYADDPTYIAAVCESMKEEIAKLDFEPELVLASFHGVPVSYLKKGDPYHCQCHKTARLMREYLDWGADGEKLKITFQSRFGPEEWLQPYTDKTVEQLAKDGVKKLAVVTPGFSADCVETLEEIAGEAGEIFEEHGGEHFAAIPCLNDSDHGMTVIEALVRRELAGWV
ncbi:MAG: ferrochelatase [Pseudomonadota bacterium]